LAQPVVSMIIMSVRSPAQSFLLPAFTNLLPVSLPSACSENDGDDPVDALAAAGEEGKVPVTISPKPGPTLYPQHEVLVDRTNNEDPVQTTSLPPRCCNIAEILQNSLMATLRDYGSYGDSGAKVYIADFVG